MTLQGLTYGAMVTLLAVAAASCVNTGSKESRVAAPVEKSDLTAEARHWSDSVTGAMDTAELAAQVLMPAVYSSDDIWTMRQVRQYASKGVGGVVLLKGTSVHARALSDTMRRYSREMPFMAIDAEWGLNMRLADAPKFPANGNLSPRVEDQVMYDYGREVARESRALGINMVLGPVLDVSDDNNFLGVRCFAGGALRVSELGVAYGRGLTDGNVIPVAKHFPGHGTVTTDSHKGKGVISGSLQQLDSVDLVPFREWVNASLPAVMVGHLAVPSIDSRMLPAALSPTVIEDLLRGDLGFRGLVMTDALNMLGAEGRSSVDALIAGADLILAPVDTDAEMSKIVDAVRQGSLPIDVLREHVARILFYKYLVQADPDEDQLLETAVTDTIINRLNN